MLGGEVCLHFGVIARELIALAGRLRGHLQRIDGRAIEAAGQKCFHVPGFQRDTRALVQTQVKRACQRVEGDSAMLDQVVGQQRAIEETVATCSMSWRMGSTASAA